jgi:hypothetical protein
VGLSSRCIFGEPHGQNSYFEKHEDEYVPHDYLTLEFENDRLTEIVHQADETQWNSERAIEEDAHSRLQVFQLTS